METVDKLGIFYQARNFKLRQASFQDGVWQTLELDGVSRRVIGSSIAVTASARSGSYKIFSQNTDLALEEHNHDGDRDFWSLGMSAPPI